MRRSNWDLGLVAVLTVIVVALVWTEITDEFPFMLLPVLLVLVLPGYALVEALFPDRELDVPARAALTLGTSLAVGSLGGLVLHWTSMRLEAMPWAILLASLTLTFSVVAFARRQGHVSRSEPERNRQYSFSWLHGAIVVLAVLITVSAVAFARNEAREQASADFTQLWVLPVSDGTANTVEIGVSNHHFVDIDYQLVVYADGTEYLTETFRVDADDEWTTEISVPEDSDSVEARLYLQDAPVSVHRRVSLTLGS